MPSLPRRRPQLRPLRPPLRKSYRATPPRFFTPHPHHKHLSLSRPVRPSLVFLSPPRLSRPNKSFLSTEAVARYLKQQTYLAGKYMFVAIVVSSAWISWCWMLTQEFIDREFPAPKEWSFLSKVGWHCGKGCQVPGAANPDGPAWESAGCAFLDLVKRLEDPEGDGRGIVWRRREERYGLEPDGQLGIDIFDVSAKGYEWRRGYYEALMGCARAAVALDEVVFDSQTRQTWHKDFVVGPSNPKPQKLRPRTVRRGYKNPREEFCRPAFARPEGFLQKILDTEGFSNREKMEAALAWATYADVGGDVKEAERLYYVALDFAEQGVDKPEAILNRADITIKPDAVPTDNILRITAAIAIHRARTGDINAALPMFLSILRARRMAPAGPAYQALPNQRPLETKVRKTDLEAMNDTIQSFWNLLQASEFPPPEPTGNEPFLRTPESHCHEASAMSNIGELLYASSRSRREEGLSWTKSAQELAYQSYQDPRTSREAKLRSADCIKTASKNRQKMIQLFLDEIAAGERAAQQASWWQRPLLTALGRGASALQREKAKWQQQMAEAMDFDAMLMRARFFAIDELRRPVWGTWLVTEYLLPRLQGRLPWERPWEREGLSRNEIRSTPYVRYA